MSRYVLVCDTTYYPFIAGYVDAPDAPTALSYLNDDIEPWHAFLFEDSAYRSGIPYDDPRLEPIDEFFLKPVADRMTREQAPEISEPSDTTQSNRPGSV